MKPWQWRPFSEVCARTVYGRFERGEKATVLHIATGMGKTATMVRIHKEFNERSGRQFRAVVYAPRVALTGQIKQAFLNQTEVGADGLEQRLDLGNVRDHGQHTNDPPFIPPTAFIIISTYQALQRDTIGVQAQSWRAHRDNFILYLDEAGLLSIETRDELHVTQVVKQLEEAARHAAHVVLLTGTPRRHDGGRLPFAAGCYTPGSRPGHWKFHADETFLYKFGVEAPEGAPHHGPYLRRFDFHLVDVGLTWKPRDVEPADDEALDGEGRQTYERWLSDGERRISGMLDKREFIEKMLDIGLENLQRLRERASDDRLAMLVACKDKTHLLAVQSRLVERFPAARVAAAYSEMGAESLRTLADFRQRPGAYDILLTVRQAFIGYDAPHITVVVVLTHYRDKSHLTQLIGRGLRIWNAIPPERQQCFVVGPQDKLLQRLCEQLRNDALKAEAWDPEKGPPPPPSGLQDELVGVEWGDTTAFTGAGEMSWREVQAARAAMRGSNLDGTEADFLRAMRVYGQHLREPTSPEPTVQDVVDETTLCDRLRAEASAKGKKAAWAFMQKEGITVPKNGHWEEYNKLVFRWVDRVDGLGQVKTFGKSPDALRRRITSLDDLLAWLG